MTKLYFPTEIILNSTENYPCLFFLSLTFDKEKGRICTTGESLCPNIGLFVFPVITV